MKKSIPVMLAALYGLSLSGPVAAAPKEAKAEAKEVRKSGAEEAKEMRKSAAEEAKQKRREHERAKTRDDEDSDEFEVDKSEGKGSETAQEMRARRDERKAIQEEYRANREPGQEGKTEEGEAKKKPWWRFWE